MKCPKCGSTDVYIQDDSFDYDIPFGSGSGTEVIKYPVCNKCGFNDEDSEYEFEDWEIEDA